jgi:hypothetical protein
VDANARITHFELGEASLEQIFIERVGTVPGAHEEAFHV